MSRLIERSTTIEELVHRYPGSVRYLLQRGLPCLVCGEATWGTLEQLAREKGISEKEIDLMIGKMNSLDLGEAQA